MFTRMYYIGYRNDKTFVLHLHHPPDVHTLTVEIYVFLFVPFVVYIIKRTINTDSNDNVF